MVNRDIDAVCTVSGSDGSCLSLAAHGTGRPTQDA